MLEQQSDKGEYARRRNSCSLKVDPGEECLEQRYADHSPRYAPYGCAGKLNHLPAVLTENTVQGRSECADELRPRKEQEASDCDRDQELKKIKQCVLGKIQQPAADRFEFRRQFDQHRFHVCGGEGPQLMKPFANKRPILHSFRRQRYSKLPCVEFAYQGSDTANQPEAEPSHRADDYRQG